MHHLHWKLEAVLRYWQVPIELLHFHRGSTQCEIESGSRGTLNSRTAATRSPKSFALRAITNKRLSEF